MIYSNDEALKVHDRILELMKLYDLTCGNACRRVGLNPTSWVSLERRVKKILKPVEVAIPIRSEDVPQWLEERNKAYPIEFKD